MTTSDTIRPKGSLSTVRLSDIFQSLQRELKTGVLTVKTDAILKKVFIWHGDVVFATSNNKEDRLAELLVREGRMSREDHMKAEELLGRQKGRMGRILVDLGYLKPNEVYQAVQRQVEEIILGLFSLEEGEYDFQEGPLPSDELIKLRISTGDIIYRGIKRISNRQYIQQVCPPENTVLDFSQDPSSIFQHVTMEDVDRKILSLIDGKSPIRKILSLASLDHFETLKTIYAFLSIGIVEVREEEAEKTEETEETVVHHAREAVAEPHVVVSKEFVEKIEDMFNRLERLGYYEVLGVGKDSSFGEIKKAAYRVIKEFHPDRRFSLPSDNIVLKKKLTTIQAYIVKAYQTLHDPDKRKGYDSLLSKKAFERTKKAAVVVAVLFVVFGIVLALSGDIRKKTASIPEIEKKRVSEGRKVSPEARRKLLAPSGRGSYELTIYPRTVFRDSVLTLSLGNFSLSNAEIEWFINENAVEGAEGRQFKPDNVRKGDMVYARVFVDDEVVTSDAVVIKNSPPLISRARILPEVLKPGESLYVEAAGRDSDGDEVTLFYEWTRNGEPAGDTMNLQDELVRGDTYTVKITPFDDDVYGKSVVFKWEMGNMPPMITEEKQFQFDGTVYTHQVQASDPDGDDLTYSLTSEIETIAIDSGTGLITWNVPADFTGSVPATVSVNDGHGGEVKRELVFIINAP
jgi:hypothetical protein